MTQEHPGVWYSTEKNVCCNRCALFVLCLLLRLNAAMVATEYVRR